MGVLVEEEPKNQPYFYHRYVMDNDFPLNCYWVLDEKIHNWFVEAGIPYKIVYEIDWWVEVPDEHALMVKLTWGGDVSLN